jgi:DedD protein
MARSTSDEEIRLRKRARRRLIGAIALTTLVVVALPMILDSEPRQAGDDIAVQIPSPNSGPYSPKGAAADASRSPSRDVPKAPAAASKPIPSPAEAPAASGDTGSAAALPPTKASGAIGSAATPADMKIAVAGATRPAGDPSLPPGSAAAAAPAETPSPVAAAGVAGPADPATAAPADAKAAKGVENYVIQLGAFAEVGRAKDRHAQLVKAGIKSYTEVIKTPTGDKTRVRAGPFPTREAADKANERVKALGITDGVVVTRRY